MAATDSRTRLRAWDLAAVAAFLVLALALASPLLPRLATHVASDPGDPLLNTWILWWNAHVPPWSDRYWHAPAFAPAPDALTLSETLLGLTPLTSPLQWLGASPLVAYNLLFVLTPFLNGCAGYALARQLTGRGDAALVGGLAFMLAPYRAAQLPHVQTLAAFYMPVALVGLHEYWRTGRARWLGVLLAATIGNGLVSGYHLVYFALPLGVALIWMASSAADWRRPAAVAATLGVALVALLPVLLPYARAHERWDLRRGIGEMQAFSADVASFAAAAPTLVWNPLPKPIDIPEGDVYPGLALVACLCLGLVAWTAERRSRRSGPAQHSRSAEDLSQPRWATWLRRGLLLVAVGAGLTAAAGWLAGPFAFGWGPLRVSVTSLNKPFGAMLSALLAAAMLSPRVWASARRGGIAGLYVSVLVASVIFTLGPEGHLLGERFWYKAPSAWLLELPGFDTVRVPARWATITVLAGSTLAALATAAWQSRARRGGPAVIAVLSGALILDGFYRLPIAEVPPALPVTVSADLAIELPTRGWKEDVEAMYHGMTHGRPVVNGYSGHAPPHYALLSQDLETRCFESLEALRRGRSLDVVVHVARFDGEAVLDAARRQWPGVAEETGGGVVVMRIPRGPLRAETAYDDPIDIDAFCHASRAAARESP